jgi:hypothetical protein
MAANHAPYDPTDPDLLTPEQRLEELAAILAAGTRRLLSLRPPSLPVIDQDSSPNRLDVRSPQSVYGQRS